MRESRNPISQIPNLPETLAPALRRQMLRESIYHQEALTRQTWSLPPMAPGDHAASYAEILLDPTVSYAVRLLQDAVLAEPWHVEPPEASGAGASPATRAVALAEDLRMQLADVDVETALQNALDALWRGFWPHEIVWEYRIHSGAGAPARGQHRLRELASIDPDQVALELDEQMRITAILSRPVGGPTQRLPKEKLWMHVNKPSRTRPAGESILEPAHRAWSSKNRLLQFWGLSIQRFGMTALKVTIPANTPPARQSTILSTLHDGRLDGIYLLPEDIMVEELHPTQWANLTFEQAIDYQDAEIVKAIILARNPGNVAAGQTYVTGAGLGEQARATAYRLKRISRALAESFNRQVIQPLCLSNYGLPPSLCPRLVLPSPDPTRLQGLAAPIAQLRTAGIVDAAVAAEILGLPEPVDRAHSYDRSDQSDQSAPSDPLDRGRNGL